jgi:hypothetical protein
LAPEVETEIVSGITVKINSITRDKQTSYITFLMFEDGRLQKWANLFIKRHHESLWARKSFAQGDSRLQIPRYFLEKTRHLAVCIRTDRVHPIIVDNFVFRE